MTPSKNGIFGGLATIATVISLASLTHSTPAQAAIKAIGGSLTVPTVVGEHYLTFRQNLGFSGDLWLDGEWLFGKHWDLHATATYQPNEIRQSSNVVLQQGIVYFGPEYRSKPGGKKDEGLALFTSIEGGLVVNFLSFSDASNTTLNTNLRGAARFRPGFSYELFDDGRLQFSTPIEVIFDNPILTRVNLTLSLRYSL